MARGLAGDVSSAPVKLRGPASWPSLAAIFAAALVVVHGWAGDSPALWLDTLNDQREVRQCVLRGSCTLLGQAASINGIFQPTAGLRRGRCSFVSAWTSTPCTSCSRRSTRSAWRSWRSRVPPRGRLLGALAAFLLVYDLGNVGAMQQALYNSTPLSFLGAVLLIACVAAVERPGLLPSVVTALLAAVMTNFHAACAATGATVVLVALLPPGGRLLRAAVTTASFVAASFAIAPLGWLADARFFLHGGPGAAAASAVPLSISAVAAIVQGDPIACFSAIGLGAWLFAAVTRRPTLRRKLDVSTAVVAPLLVAYIFALRHGVPDSGGKYLVHIKPAAALGVAAPVVALASGALSRVRLAPRVSQRCARWARGPCGFALGRGARHPHLHALRRRARRAPSPRITMRDVDAFARVLRDERGWSRAHVRRHVKAIEQSTVLTGLLDEARGGFCDPPRPPGGPSDEGADDGINALLLVLDIAELPNPVPPSWTVARRTASSAAG